MEGHIIFSGALVLNMAPWAHLGARGSKDINQNQMEWTRDG